MFLINSNATRAKCHNNEGHDEGCGNNVSYLGRCVMWGVGGGERERLSAPWPLWGGERVSQYTSVKTNYVYSLFDFFLFDLLIPKLTSA